MLIAGDGFKTVGLFLVQIFAEYAATECSLEATPVLRVSGAAESGNVLRLDSDRKRQNLGVVVRGILKWKTKICNKETGKTLAFRSLFHVGSK